MMLKRLAVVFLVILLGCSYFLREHAKEKDYGWLDGFWRESNASSLADIFEMAGYWPTKFTIFAHESFGKPSYLKYSSSDKTYKISDGQHSLGLPLLVGDYQIELQSCVGRPVRFTGIIAKNIFGDIIVTRLDTLFFSAEGVSDFSLCYASEYSELHPDAPLLVGTGRYAEYGYLSTQKAFEYIGDEKVQLECLEDYYSWMKGGECVWATQKEAAAFEEKNKVQ